MALQDLGAAGALYQDFMASGKAALADDGELYDTVQGAVDAATGFVLAGPGTYQESVSVTTNGLTLVGVGNTLIDGDTGFAVELDADNLRLANLRLQTTRGGGNYAPCVKHGTSSGDVVVSNVTVEDCDQNAFDVAYGSWTVQNCRIKAAENNGLYIYGGDRHRLVNNTVESVGRGGIQLYFNQTEGKCDDSVVAGNRVFSTGDDGISVNAHDCTVVGNRVHNAGDYGIHVGASSVDVTVANNRVSGSTNANINDGGTTTTTDANATGAAN